jgi:TonB family protein
MGTSALEINTMRKVIVATLAFLPIVLHAQANSPAQPRSASTPTLQSALLEPSEFGAAVASNRSTTVPTSTPLRVSSGVVGPKLIHTVEIVSDGNAKWDTSLDRTVIVEMIVDASGKPSDLKIAKSLGTTMDRNVLAAVSQYRFKPGTVSHQATAVPLRLEIDLRSSQR